MVFSEELFRFPMLLKKIFWFWWRKKIIIWFRVFTYNLMLNSGKKFRTLRDKKINILTLVVSQKKILNETKNHNPPFKLNGRSLRLIKNWHLEIKIFNLQIQACYFEIRSWIELHSQKSINPDDIWK